MGFSPAVIDAMSLWSFFCCVEGYRRAHSTEEPAPTPSDDLMRRIDGDI